MATQIFGFRRSRDGYNFTHNFKTGNTNYVPETDQLVIDCLNAVYNEYKNLNKNSLSEMDAFINRHADEYWVTKYDLVNKSAAMMIGTPASTTEATTPAPTLSDEDKLALTNALENFQDFMSEFSFEPSYRCVNTFVKYLKKSQNAGKQYLKNYFSLTDNPDADTLANKCKSSEFQAICDALTLAPLTNTVNNRFKVFFGAPGGGKTMAAEKEVSDMIICHSGMLPQDLMEDFDFNDENGNPVFKHSALWSAMVNGTKICLDEINLLSMDCVRFLQGLLDNKKSFRWKDQMIDIADGFEVIGTMNLNVNGTTYCLPEPLVDRAYEIKEFKVSAKNLLSAII